jgi:hypothetical protein
VCCFLHGIVCQYIVNPPTKVLVNPPLKQIFGLAQPIGAALTIVVNPCDVISNY